MHVIDRQDNFTLIGSDARRGKLTLFDAEGPRERGAFKHVALRVSSARRNRTASTLARAESRCSSSRRRPTSSTTSITSRCTPSDPEAHGRGVPRLRLLAGGAEGRRAARRGRRRVRRVPPGRSRRTPSGRCSTTSPCSSTPRTTTSATRRTLGIEVERFVDAANTLRGLPLGPGPRSHRVRRAQAQLLADLSAATLHIAGAGMAGLCAAARARELGLDVVVYEKGDRPGGSMLLSSCVVWRYRDLDAFRAECPGGDAELQREVIERLDDGHRVAARRSARRSSGRRRATRAPSACASTRSSLTDVLARAAGDVRLGEPAPDDAEPLAARDRRLPGRPRARARAHRARAASCSSARTAGAPATGCVSRSSAAPRSRAGMDEFYGRAMPAPPAAVPEERFVELAQLYGRHALVLDDAGDEFAPDPVSWSETDLVQAIAQRPNASAWYLVDEDALDVEIRGRTVREMVEAAREAGGEVLLAERARHRASRRVPLRRARRRRHHAHDRRPAHRPAGARRSRRTARRSRACTRQAPTRAASRRAATRAASRRRSSSAASPPRRPRPRKRRALGQTNVTTCDEGDASRRRSGATRLPKLDGAYATRPSARAVVWSDERARLATPPRRDCAQD